MDERSIHRYKETEQITVIRIIHDTISGVTIAPAAPAGRGGRRAFGGRLPGAHHFNFLGDRRWPLSSPLLGPRQIFWPLVGRCGHPSFIKTPLGPLKAPLTSILLNAERAPLVQNLVRVQIFRLEMPIFCQDNNKKKKKEQWRRLPG